MLKVKLDVRPRLPPLDLGNLGLGNSIVLAYYLLGPSVVPYLRHVSLRYFGMRVERPSGRDVTALYNHVAVVVSDSSQKKMVRINAAPIVTPMENAKAVWHFAIKYLVGDAVRKLWLAINGKHSITVGVSVCCPLPARCGLADLLHKSDFHIHHCIH